MSSRKSGIAVFLTILMFSSVTTAAVSNWNGPSGLAGTSKSVSDAFNVPGKQPLSMRGFMLMKAAISKTVLARRGPVKTFLGTLAQGHLAIR